MLFKIDNKTSLDLPRWKCRQEFADYYLAKRDSRNDVDLLAKLKAKCDAIELTHKKRQAASHRTASKMWQRPNERQRVDKSQAIPVDVFDFNGTFIATFPSARKAAIGMFGEERYHSNERCIRATREGKKKSHLGFMFRDHQDGVTQVEPYKRKERPSMKGRHYNRRPNTFATQRVGEILNGEIVREWNSIKEAAYDLGLCVGTIYSVLKYHRIMRDYGTSLVRIGERRLQFNRK